MTPTISPVAGALPMQPSAATPPPSSCAGASAAPAVGIDPAAAATTAGGAQQAVQGAAVVGPEQLVPILQQAVAAVSQLVSILQQQGGVAGAMGGGAPTQVPPTGCGCGGAAGAAAGAMGAPEATSSGAGTRRRKQRRGDVSAGDARHGAEATAPGGTPSAAPPPSMGSTKDKTSTSGLTGASLRGLQEAHRFGLPLVSGKRSGGGSSDHDHGNAIDVADIPIGVASSTEGSPRMKSFAEHMRQQGKAGKLDVKYIIRDGQIASAVNDWAWRDYTYPGKSAADLAALKRSSPGEYNRLQHYDHVHVSFG